MSGLHARVGFEARRLGKYRLLAGLGRGGMATVHLAVHHGPAGFNKLVVIKQIHVQHAEDPEMMAMFLAEARLAARLQHQNVVQTNEIGEDAGRHFMVMEFLDGQPLSRLIHRLGGRVPLAVHLRIIADLLSGLHHAHELTDYDGSPLGVVHRDANPQNVFVTYDGMVKVVDFGIAKSQNSLVHTAAGIVKGKIAYMAPEQIRGEDIDRRADIFAVGVMLWEAVTGVRPWKGVADLTVLKTVVEGNFPSVRAACPDIPPELEAIIHKALARSPEDRHATAAELQADIEAYLDSREERVSQRDIAQLVSSVFEAEHAEIKAVIEEQLRYIEATPGSDPGHDGGGPQSPGLAGLMMFEQSPTPTLHSEGTPDRSDSTAASSPWARRGGPSSGSHPIGPSTFAVSVPDPRARTPRQGLWRIATMVAGAALVASLGWGWSKAPAQASGATTATTPADAAHVELRLTASPPEARLFIDDQPLVGNPWKGALARDQVGHRIRVEASGFAPRTEMVTFDKDRVVDVALAPQPLEATELGEPPGAGAGPGTTAVKTDRASGKRHRRLDDKNPYVNQHPYEDD